MKGLQVTEHSYPWKGLMGTWPLLLLSFASQKQDEQSCLTTGPKQWNQLIINHGLKPLNLFSLSWLSQTFIIMTERPQAEYTLWAREQCGDSRSALSQGPCWYFASYPSTVIHLSSPRQISILPRCWCKKDAEFAIAKRYQSCIKFQSSIFFFL
jgi:hypothetical protein